MSLVPHPHFPERAQLFFEKYDLIDIIGTGDEERNQKPLAKRSDRVCRFCDRKKPEATFKKRAHLVSRFIGNSELFSDFECDDCNGKFGGFETDLSYYLGISRSILGLSESKKPPSLVAKRISLKSRSFIGQDFLILSMADIDAETTEEDRKAGITKFTYTKPSYIPSSIYKALMKASLSILPEHEVKSHYKVALDYLRGGKFLNGVSIHGYLLPLQINMPLHMFIFQKKNGNEKIPFHVIGFYFQNRIIYVPVHLHKEDIPHYGQDLEIPYAPPYFVSNDPVLNLQCKPYQTEVSSNEIRKDDIETVTMVLDPNELKQTGKYDFLKDEFLEAEYAPSGTKYIIFTRKGTSFTQDQIREFMKFIQTQEDEITANS